MARTEEENVFVRGLLSLDLPGLLALHLSPAYQPVAEFQRYRPEFCLYRDSLHELLGKAAALQQLPEQATYFERMDSSKLLLASRRRAVQVLALLALSLEFWRQEQEEASLLQEAVRVQEHLLEFLEKYDV